VNQISQLVPLVILGGIFYFLVIRPQQQRAKQHAETVEALAPGVEIVTIGGIFGVVVATGDRVRIRVVDGSELELLPSAVGRIVSPATPEIAEQPAEPAQDAELLADASEQEETLI